jgi:fucose 4-O-acetylase-like acetyltransferase
MINSEGNREGWLSKAFNLSILNTRRMAWVDYLRGIAIILVVYRHVLIGIERSGLNIPLYLTQANEMFFSFRMPLFFILSGLFISNSLTKYSLGKIVDSKFQGLLYPYFIWAFLQITLQIFLSRYTNAERTTSDYLYILYQPRGLDQFWYLPALFNATIIYILLKTKVGLSRPFQLGLGVLLYIIGPYFREISMISDWMEFYIFFAIGDAVAPLFFKPRTQKFLNSRTALFCLLPVFIVSQLYFLHRQPVNQAEFLAVSLTGCLFMFLFAYQIQGIRRLSFLRVLGYHSLYIYVMHVIVSAGTRFILTKYAGIENASLLLFAGIVTGVLIPVMVYNLLIRKHLWFLFRYRRPGPTPTTQSSNEISRAS